MATTAELIKGLVENRDALMAQVTALNNAIAALGGMVVTPATPAAPKAAKVEAAPAVVKGKPGRKPKDPNAAPAPKAAKAEAAGKRGGRKAAEIKQVTEYSEATSWNEKVVWALGKAPQMTSDDIANIIAQFEKDSDLNKLKTMVSSYASTLFKKNVIGARREGRGYVYFLKK